MYRTRSIAVLKKPATGGRGEGRGVKGVSRVTWRKEKWMLLANQIDSHRLEWQRAREGSKETPVHSLHSKTLLSSPVSALLSFHLLLIFCL